MKPTQEQVMDMMKECNLIEIVARHDDGTVTAQIPNITNMKRFADLAYEAGRKDENEAIAQMIEDAPPLVDFAKNEHGGCVICGFTPKLAAFTIRERNAL